MIKRSITQNQLFTFILCLIAFSLNASEKDKLPKPLHSYSADITETQSQLITTGNNRLIDFQHKRGIHPAEMKSRIVISKHNLNNEMGSVEVWIMALEDISTHSLLDRMRISNPLHQYYPVLSDFQNPQNYFRANFSFQFNAYWTPNLMVLYGNGPLYEDAFKDPHKVFVGSNHFSFRQHKWYQLTLTWNNLTGAHNLYVNGIKVGTENRFYSKKQRKAVVGDTLFTGNPALCYSSFNFYPEELTQKQIVQLFEKNGIADPRLEKEMKLIYEGKGRKKFNFSPDGKWELKLNLSLTNPDDMNHFHIQGYKGANITPEGLLAQTPLAELHPSLLDSQMYIWTRKPFEGDLYIEYQFKILYEGGLSLLMTQASGMNREDFMNDYPIRTSGRMTMVCWEDVRNYHWEYYREMDDVRNDIISSALVKNPFEYPLSYGCINKTWEKNTWHTLQWLQKGNKLIGAIDGIVMVEAEDESFMNNGTVYNFGRIAIRCMLNTQLIIRNLKIYNNELQYKVTR